jgi:PadR family transcriptional regulator PadR
MSKQMTEMLKGTLEGIVLALLSGRAAYGYEITAWLREQGFADIAEGTVYALLVRIEQRGLVDVEKVPSEKGPPRKVYSLNAQGRSYLDEFWRTWRFLAARLEQLRTSHPDDADGGGNAVDPDNRINPDNSDNSDKES